MYVDGPGRMVADTERDSILLWDSKRGNAVTR